MAEKRHEHRWSQRLRVHVWEHGEDKPLVGYTENVSPGGVFLAVPRPLTPGARVRLELLADEKSYMAEGLVVHTRRVPRELQKVKQAGMGITLMPFESFLKEVRPSGATMSASGVWRMSSEDASSGSWVGGVAQPGRTASRAPLRASGAAATERPTEAASVSTARSRPLSPFAREDPHDRTRRETGRGGPTPTRSRDDDTLLYTVRFDTPDEFLRAYDTDIKMGIFFVTTTAPAPEGAVVVLAMEPPSAKRPLRFKAQAVRGAGAMGGSSGMLVRFLEPSAVREGLGLFAKALRR